MYLILLALAWIIYFVLHSFLAANTVKQWVKHHLNFLYVHYRIFYNLFSIIGLVVLIYMTISNPVLIIKPNMTTLLSGLILNTIGTAILLISFMTFDLKEFLGLKPTDTTSLNNGELIVSGIYKYVRHPLYFGLILIGLGVFLLFPAKAIAVTIAIMYLYIIIGSKLEERKLINEFGNHYIEYSKNVKALIPFIY